MILTRKTIHALFNCGCPNAPQAAILDITDTLAWQAEDAADAREDR